MFSLVFWNIFSHCTERNKPQSNLFIEDSFSAQYCLAMFYTFCVCVRVCEEIGSKKLCLCVLAAVLPLLSQIVFGFQNFSVAFLLKNVVCKHSHTHTHNEHTPSFLHVVISAAVAKVLPKKKKRSEKKITNCMYIL